MIERNNTMEQIEKPTILIIDDEQPILDLIIAYLQPEGYKVHTAANGPEGLKAAQKYHPDLIVLDIMLPGMDGLELLAQIRRISDVYVILLTAKTEETDKIIGLSIGADDFVTKPFSPRELVARIKAVLRRTRPNTSIQSENPVLVFKHVRIDPASRQVWVNNKPVELTAIEFALSIAAAVGIN